MEQDPILKRTREILDNLPDTEMSPTSRRLLRESPLDWVASRKRSLRSALLEGDQEAVDAIVDDVAHVIGIREANWWMLSVMEDFIDFVDMDPDLE